MRSTRVRAVLLPTLAVLAVVLAQAAHALPTADAYPVYPPSFPVGDTGPGTVATPRTVPSTPSARKITFVGADHAAPQPQLRQEVAVPAGARAGDRAVLVFSSATGVVWSGPSGLNGWTQASSAAASRLRSTVYTKSLVAADVGRSVRFDTNKSAKASLSIAVYSGIGSGAQLAAVSRVNRGSTSHLSAPTSTAPGDVVLSYWVDHKDSTTSWRASNATTRDTAIGTGRGRYGSLLADSSISASGVSFEGRVATTNAATSSIAWTVRLPGESTPLNPPTPPSPEPAPGQVTKLLVVVEENETTAAFAQMPYLRSLANAYGNATRFSGLTHPSAGNYLAMVSGQGTATCGLRDPLPALCPQSGPTVFGRALAAGLSAKTYGESMETPCQATNSNPYAARHNPWTYFIDERSKCALFNVGAGTTSSGALRSDIDAGSMPNAGMLIPNLLNDAHDGPLDQADDWLRSWMPRIMNGADYQSGRLAVVITFDEGAGANQNIPFVVVHRSLSGDVVSAPFTHYGLSRLYTDVLGVSPLGAGSTEPGLRKAFGL